MMGVHTTFRTGTTGFEVLLLHLPNRPATRSVGIGRIVLEQGTLFGDLLLLQGAHLFLEYASLRRALTFVLHALLLDALSKASKTENVDG